jgi:hypothetical protein
MSSHADDDLDPIDDGDATIGGLRYGGALTLASIFKGLGVVAVVVGIALALSSTRRLGGSLDNSWIDKFTFAGGTLLSTMLTASALVFFGSILEIGVGCWEQLWHLRYDEGPDDDPTV